MQKRRAIDTVKAYSYKPFDDYHCIFVHIPKAAGVSVSHSLFGNLAGGHTPVWKYQIVFSNNEFERYFKFTFVRNPWNRLFSAYNFLKKGGMDAMDHHWAEDNLAPFQDFDEFVKRWVNKRNILQNIHFVPQYRFLCLPFVNEPVVDFLGYYENIQEDFNYIQKRIFGNNNRVLSFHNKTSANGKLDYREFYTNVTRSIVADVYEKDIAMFGYNFDNSSSKLQLINRSI